MTSGIELTIGVVLGGSSKSLVGRRAAARPACPHAI